MILKEITITCEHQMETQGPHKIPPLRYSISIHLLLVRMDQLNNFCTRHILSFVEVYYLEIVIGRLRAASRGFPARPWSLVAGYALKKIRLNQQEGMIKENTATLYYRFLKRTGRPCGAKLDQVISGHSERGQ